MTNTYIASLIAKYRTGSLVVDTNLLILYLVGNFNPDRISSFKRTQVYSQEDFYTLKSLVRHFSSVVTTPNILTEVSNLSSSLSQQFEHKIFTPFQKLIASLTEEYVQSIAASRHESFVRFGLTDSVIWELAKRDYLVLTDDFPLFGYLQSHRIDAINFNHIRSERWLYQSP
jgi:hypothetical protein